MVSAVRKVDPWHPVGDTAEGWGHLRGYAVATDPAEPALKLLIAGFRSEKELESFVLRLRGAGLLTLYDVEGRVNGETPSSDPQAGR